MLHKFCWLLFLSFSDRDTGFLHVHNGSIIHFLFCNVHVNYPDVGHLSQCHILENVTKDASWYRTNILVMQHCQSMSEDCSDPISVKQRHYSQIKS